MSFARLGARSRPSILIEGAERWAELTSYGIVGKDGDQSFADSMPQQDQFLTGTAYQSLDHGSLYRFARERTGSEAGFLLAPLGNVEPTENAPLYLARVLVGPRPDLGGDSSTRTFLFSFAWRIVGTLHEITDPWALSALAAEFTLPTPGEAP